MSAPPKRNMPPDDSLVEANDEEMSAEMEIGSDARACMKCPACGYAFITKVNGKRKLRTRVLIFAKNGNTMGICPKCKAHLRVPVVLKG